MNEPEIIVTPVENNDATANPPEDATVTAPLPEINVEVKPSAKTYFVPNRHDRRKAKALARKQKK